MLKRFISGSFVATILGTFMSGPIAAAVEGPQVVPVGASRLFVAKGFDDNDRVTLVLDGYLPNGCYKVANVVVKVNPLTNTVDLTQMAYVFEGPCIKALIPYSNVVDIGVLPQGDFKLSTNDGRLTKQLLVKEANSSGPDDFLYAPVDSVQVERRENAPLQPYAVLTGRLTTTCVHWKETKVIDSGESIEILPVIEQDEFGDHDCEFNETPFRVVVELPKKDPGRYLLHVRSLNGKALNQIFALYEDR